MIIMKILFGVSGEGLSIKPEKDFLEKEKKILGLFEKKGRIKNDDVENLLGVSDASATRYLQQLENKGLIVQRGEGSAAYYERS